MKRTLLLVTMIMTVGVVSAQIWSESFSTNSPPTLNSDSYAQITNEYTTGQWTTLGGSVDADGNLRLIVDNWSGQVGMPWGTSIALDDSLFAADTYRLTLDISAIQGDAILGVRIYDASIGSGGTNNYYEINNYKYGLMNKVDVIPVGDATTNLLADVEFNSAQAGIRAIDFTYDGSGDVVVVLMALSEGAVANRWAEINEISVDVATPNPQVPSFALENYDITPAATENVPYTNNTLLATITSNPGFEPLEYAAGKANWMTISSGGEITGTPTTGGTNTFYISVADQQGAYDWATFSLFVTNNNDAPVINTWSNNIWEADALTGIPYNQDLSGYVSDEDGDLLTFSINSGPSWLHMATNGVLTGSPAGSDTGANEWEFIVTDGTASATGTLYIAVKLVSVVQVETFDGAAFQNADPQVWTFDKATTAISNGTWIGNWSLPKFTTPGGDSQLRLYTPNNGNAIATRSLLLDETLFTAGAGTYVLQFELEDLTLSGTTLYIDLYDVSLDGGGSVDIDSYFWWDLNSYAGLPGIVTNIAPATADLITNLSWVGMTEGIETAEFDYDGSGDVLINIGASKPSTAGTDWWRIHLDDFYVYSFVEVGYDLWVTGYGLNGTNAAATYDYDGDGWENLLEYGLGLNPTNDLADGGAYPTFTQEASGMAYVHAQRTDDPSLTYSLLTKTDLISGEWTETGYPVSTNLTGGTYNYITNSIPTTDPRKFIRLKIEQSP